MRNLPHRIRRQLLRLLPALLIRSDHPGSLHIDHRKQHRRVDLPVHVGRDDRLPVDVLHLFDELRLFHRRGLFLHIRLVGVQHLDRVGYCYHHDPMRGDGGSDVFGCGCGNFLGGSVRAAIDQLRKRG